jgi:POT family proton-dependent oligopeptide transporter
MAINVGSIAALFVGPSLSHHFGYSYAYLASFIGILLGLANYFFQRQHIKSINTPEDQQPVSFRKWVVIVMGIFLLVWMSSYLLQHVILARNLVWFIVLVVVSIYLFYMQREELMVRKEMLLAFILMLEGVLFFTLYQQMPTSINLFAVHNVRPFLFGFSIDPQSFQALNPIWIVILSPLLVMGYARLDRRGISFSISYKFALGMTCCSLSFLILYASRFMADSLGMVSSGWLIMSYLFQGLGELLVSALGLAMIAELVPEKISGFVMGMWFLTSSVAGFLGALVASYTALPKNAPSGVGSLEIYTNVFALIGGLSMLVALVLWASSPHLNRLMEVKIKSGSAS